VNQKKEKNEERRKKYLTSLSETADAKNDS